MREVYGISKGLVKWVDLRENNRGEGGILDQIGTKGKRKTDAEQRKRREQRGLETPVVYAVNDVHELSETH